MKLLDYNSSVEKVPIVFSNDVQLFVKREDQIHPNVSGNKFRKLKYNLLDAEKLQKKTLLTFGGAYSNHISATAAAGKEFGFDTIGIIRGEELASKIGTNPTLRYARSCGMQFRFVSRDSYRNKHETDFLENLNVDLNGVYVIPEGGTNELAVKGCKEILNESDNAYDYICCSVGTGGTISGLINSKVETQKLLGFPALKGSFLRNEIHKFASDFNWDLVEDYRFGGYAKITDDLTHFINRFKSETGIPLDPIYTGKMMYGILDMIKNGFFPAQSKILAIHTGGLQGIDGMNQRLKQQNRPLIV